MRINTVSYAPIMKKHVSNYLPFRLIFSDDEKLDLDSGDSNDEGEISRKSQILNAQGVSHEQFQVRAGHLGKC